jgi:hypothetical protein
VAGHAAVDGIARVAIPGGVALFGNARSAPGRLDSEELAEIAGAAVQRLLHRSVPILWARQEHSRLSYTYAPEGPLASRPHLVGACDALITTEPWAALTIRTADCLPVVIAGDGAVAVIHAGWRGLAADILGAVVGRLAAELGVTPARIRAVIGVGVGPCHYVVGAEVIEALAAVPSSAPRWHGDGRADLAAWACGRLVRLGVAEGQIQTLPGCTACSEEYHSYRRDGAAAGRQWCAALLTP